jgi:hypothetical protein
VVLVVLVEAPEALVLEVPVVEAVLLLSQTVKLILQVFLLVQRSLLPSLFL